MRQYVYNILIILVLVSLDISAQVFPVQVNPQVLPPYSLKLSEYGTSTSEKLILNLLFTDITESNVQVRLKFFLENNAGLSVQSTDFVTGANPIFLDGGVPLRLTNIDLQAYFSLQNLLGITPQQYNTPLPEGLYQFCFEVYDVFSGRRISRKSCIPVYLVLNDPPFLNLPGNADQVLFKEPQNIIFQWTPRHLNATNVSYEFTLTELWDNQMNPQAAFLAGRPLYQTTTFATTLLYGPAEPPLLSDKKYGWRVRALVNDGISETSVFKNDGFSEIHYFTYTGSCAEPESILAEAKNNTSEKIYWQGVDHRLYNIQYRKKNTEKVNRWFSAGTRNEFTTIYNLTPGTTYEFRVGGQCIEDGPYTYSQIYEFTTTLPSDKDTTYNCGITPEIEITNQESIQQLVINETFTAGDFPVTIKEITQGNDGYTTTIPQEPEEDNEEDNTSIDDNVGLAGNQNKTFSGWGYIVVPYLNDTRIKVSFENIKINTDYQLIEGKVETDYDKKWGGLTSVNDILDVFEGDNDLRNINLDFDITIDHISIADDGSVVITNPTSGATIEYPGGDDITIMDTNPDGSRDIFHVDADGNIREGGQMAQGGPISAQNTAGITSNGEVTQLTAQGIKVEFLEYTDYTYGFDRIPSGQESKLGKYYKQIKDAQGNPYNIINKSVGNGDTDVIRARVTITDPDVSISDLVIKTIHGEKVEYTTSNTNEITLQLKGYYTFEHENIYATIQPKTNGGKQTIAGVFSQWHLANKDVNVTIVPVNGANVPSADIIGTGINTIFKQASVTFNVSVAPEMYIDKNQIGVSESGVLSNYTADQKGIINQFKSRGFVDRKSYYVFVLGTNVRPSRSGVAGFMPLKRQFGFVFSGNLSQREEGKSSLAGTLAHELGHGAFALQHPFTKLGTSQAGTDWLMDYGDGKRLSHLDWSQIHNPEFRLYLFQDEGDAALAFSALTPNWQPFTYEGEGVVSFTDVIPPSNGAVYEIIVDDKKYVWDNAGNYVYNGDILSIDKFGLDLNDPNVSNAFSSFSLQLYWNKGDCRANEIYQTTWGVFKDYIGILNLNNSENIPNGIDLIGPAGCDGGGTSCENIAIALLQPQIDAILALRDTMDTNEIITKVNTSTLCALKAVDYATILLFLEKITQEESFDNNAEKAIVKLMTSVSDSKSTKFYEDFIKRDNGTVLVKLLKTVTNAAFYEFGGTDNYSSFVLTLAQIMSRLESDIPKWKVFDMIVKEKFASLSEESTSQGLNIILASLKKEKKVHLANMNEILNLFIDMLRDPYFRTFHSSGKRLKSYVPLYRIVTTRYDYRELFTKFTMADYITLTLTPHQQNITGAESPTVERKIESYGYSWIYPSMEQMRAFQNLQQFIIEDDYVYKNFVWASDIRINNFTEQDFYNDPDDFLDKFYLSLLTYLGVGERNNEAFWASIGAVNCDSIGEIIRHINVNENAETLQNVDKEVRLNVLTYYFRCEQSIDIDEDTKLLKDAESGLGKLLTSFDPADTSVLETIQSIGLDNIYNKLTIGSNKDFNEFIIWISMQIISSGKSLELNLSETKARMAYENPSRLLQLEANLFSFQNFNSTLLKGNQIRIQSTGAIMPYNQMILVHVADSFTFLGQRFRRGEVLMIPLIQAFALSKANRDIVAGKLTWLALDVGFFALGLTQVRVLLAAGNYLRKGIVIGDLVGSGAGAVATSLNESVISQDLRYRIQMLSLFASLPTLATSVRSWDNALSKIDNDINRSLGRMTSSGSRRTLQDYYARIRADIGGGSNGIVRPSVIPKELDELFDLDFPNTKAWQGLDDDFFEAWVRFRKNNRSGNICNPN